MTSRPIGPGPATASSDGLSAIDPATAESEGSGLSPWSALVDVPHVDVAPCPLPVNATLALPGSKSYTNRALLCAAMAEGRSELSGILRSDDSYWCLDSLQRLGVGIRVEGERVTVDGIGRRRPIGSAALYIGSAGTAARFLPGLLAAGQAGRFTMDASRQMRSRPMAPLLAALRALGADITCPRTTDAPPLDIVGGSLAGGTVTMSGALSSQFISGVLMAGPLAPRGVRVLIEDHVVQQDYVAMTLDMMGAFGATTRHDETLRHMSVAPGGYSCVDLTLEADASTATYFLALAAVTKGTVTISNLGRATRQPDLRFVEVLERMGCWVIHEPHRVTVSGPDQLRGNLDVDMRPMSDATLTLAAISPFADGPVAIHGVEHIRRHESDRIAVICRALSELGVPVEERADGLTVYPADPVWATLETHEDHRVAMSLAVLGAAANGVRLLEPGCVSKTCPPFFSLLADLGLGVQWPDRPAPAGA